MVLTDKILVPYLRMISHKAEKLGIDKQLLTFLRMDEEDRSWKRGHYGHRDTVNRRAS